MACDAPHTSRRRTRRRTPAPNLRPSPAQARLPAAPAAGLDAAAAQVPGDGVVPLQSAHLEVARPCPRRVPRPPRARRAPAALTIVAAAHAREGAGMRGRREGEGGGGAEADRGRQRPKAKQTD